MWCSDTPFGVCGTYGWTGGAAPHASRERTFGGRPASIGLAAAEDAVIGADDEAGGVRFIDDGENVPSQAGFGVKIGEVDEGFCGCGSVSSADAARWDSALNPAPPTSAAAEEISNRRRFRLITAASVLMRCARNAWGVGR